MGLTNLYTPKQIEVLKSYKRPFRLMVNYGAKRSGKTVVDNDIFLMELKRVRKLADEKGVPTPQYILAGYSSKTIQSNILQELSNKYGINFNFDKHGNFELFGVKVVLAYTGSIAGLGAIRGMTAWGAYLNEASLANELVFKEILDRCSADGSRIICDTNPDNPQHWLKTTYIDNASDESRIVSHHFVLEDNTWLDPQYIKDTKARTPKGMFYDRDILGMWVSGEGMVYQDFDKNRMSVTADELPTNLEYFAGVDWGFEHHGSIVVCGKDYRTGKVYLVEEHTKQYKQIDYWVKLAKKLQNKYGSMVFHADSARPEYVARFQEEGLETYNANKNIMLGIETCAKLIAEDKFRVNSDGVDEFYNEIYQYIWNEKTGKPVKEGDHAMDSFRYAIMGLGQGGLDSFKSDYF